MARLLKSRLEEPRGDPELRISNLGVPCERQLYYRINNPSDGEKLAPATRIKFLFGDMLEELLAFFVQASGHKLEGRQTKLDLHGVPGSRDGIVDGVLVDFKSASSFSFKKFKDGSLVDNDPFGYITQINSYFDASRDDPLLVDRERVAFIAIDKQHGHICLLGLPIAKQDYSGMVREKRRMLEGTTAPARGFKPEPDGKSGNEALGVNCSYCDFKSKCHPGLRTFLYSTGPKFLTKVVYEPKVPEAK